VSAPQVDVRLVWALLGWIGLALEFRFSPATREMWRVNLRTRSFSTLLAGVALTIGIGTILGPMQIAIVAWPRSLDDDR
jgi:hypothetical protein